MLNVCFQCGKYHADKIIDSAGPYAICPECGFKHPFLQLPLMIISGASGTGKSTICRYLLGRLNNFVLLDSDILWRSEFKTPESNYRDFFETWLRVCKNISQSGRPVVLFGAGAGVPKNIEGRVERRYFSQIHYLALICANEVLSERLRLRPAWRGCDPAYIEENLRFNQWFKTYDSHPIIKLVDTTSVTIEKTVQQVTSWINQSVSGITSG